MIASRSCWRVCQRRRGGDLLCSSEKKDSLAALSAQTPIRPIEPRSRWVRRGGRRRWIGTGRVQPVDPTPGCCSECVAPRGPQRGVPAEDLAGTVVDCEGDGCEVSGAPG